MISVENFMAGHYEPGFNYKYFVPLLLHALLRNPFVKVEDVTGICNISYKAANDLVKQFCVDNILVEMTGHSRNRMFVFDAYLSLFDKR